MNLYINSSHPHRTIHVLLIELKFPWDSMPLVDPSETVSLIFMGQILRTKIRLLMVQYNTGTPLTQM